MASINTSQAKNLVTATQANTSQPARRAYSTGGTPTIAASPGQSPRATTVAQTVPSGNTLPVQSALHQAGQLPLSGAPAVVNYKTSTAQVSPTAPLKSVPRQVHAGNTHPTAPFHPSGTQSPIVLRGFGSMRGTSKQTVVVPPPQPLKPAIMARIVHP